MLVRWKHIPIVWKSCIFSMNRYRYSRFLGYSIGEIVWARHDQDGMYWPGRITFSSNQVTDTNLQAKLWSYFVQFFGYNQKIWTVDVLSYRQYRDYISKHLLEHYDSSPQLKYQYINAINYADANDNSIPVSNSIVTSKSTIFGHHVLF